MMALQGYATRYDQILPLHHGTHKLVLQGAFDSALNSGATIEFRLGHHDGPCVGTSNDNLELSSDQHGLAFRMRFPDTDLGRKARAMAESKEHTGMSIGFDYHNAVKDWRRIGGLDVVVIKRALLYEVTWLHNLTAAVEQAFASYENCDGSSLRDDSRTGKLMCDGAAVRVRRALKRLAA